ncbi:MAG TPA: hypothetical protein VN859_05010 [Steroidobacteraceae bacterium]|nr:hypothetical protein [Steroidobacteraceae bacterium]
MNEDPDLRDAFASWRRRESARTPGFEAILRRARAVSRRPQWRPAALACLALAALTAVVWRIAPEPTPAMYPPSALSLTDWHSPTDFLLTTPGSELLHAVPHIGESRGTLAPHLYAPEDHS